MTKIISLSDEAYERLKRIKGNRSFTKVVLDLTEGRKRSPLDFAGMWRDKPEMDEIFKQILEERHKRIDRVVPPW